MKITEIEGIISAAWLAIGPLIGVVVGAGISWWRDERDDQRTDLGIRAYVWALLTDLLEATNSSGRDANFNDDAWEKRLSRLMLAVHNPRCSRAIPRVLYSDIVLTLSFAENIFDWLRRPEQGPLTNNEIRRAAREFSRRRNLERFYREANLSSWSDRIMEYGRLVSGSLEDVADRLRPLAFQKLSRQERTELEGDGWTQTPEGVFVPRRPSETE